MAMMAALVLSRSAASEPVRMELSSTFAGDLPLIGEAAKKLVATIERVSGRELLFAFNEPGVLVPATATVSAASDGRIAAAWAGAPQAGVA
jgi:TRAP-type mannitol/chloroaromatic compound transport system substrate-binding protein